jgi:hypothetical protein
MSRIEQEQDLIVMSNRKTGWYPKSTFHNLAILPSHRLYLDFDVDIKYSPMFMTQTNNFLLKEILK